MGLDMYVRAEKYVSGYPHSHSQEEYEHLVEQFGVKEFVDPETPSGHVQFTVAYWRKANQIHSWFVRNVQDGEDECRPHYASREQLKDLRLTCMRVISDHKQAETLLAPAEGFFFGSYEINDYFFEQVKDTVEQLDRLLAMPEEWDFIYQSSW